jgi:hypothetical protein
MGRDVEEVSYSVEVGEGVDEDRRYDFIEKKRDGF